MNPASSNSSPCLIAGPAGGLVDCEPWCRPCEGPFTRLAKLAVVNVLGARDLSMMLFGQRLLDRHARPFHGRSMLAGAWMEKGGLVHPLASSIRNATLDTMSGRWTPWISSDLHFRYCPECLRLGFQSAIFQIDALIQCPVHKVPLRDTCPNCAKKTPAYALTNKAIALPLHCIHCREPFSDTWRPGQEMSHWVGPEDDQPFEDMGRWLTKIGHAEIDWPDMALWFAESGPEQWRDDKRRAIFAALASLIPLPESICASAPALRVYIGPCLTASLENRATDIHASEAWQKTAIYKSIRRQNSRKTGININRGGIKRLCRYQVDWHTDAIIPEENSVNAAEHGLLLWQVRCEERVREIALSRAPFNRPKGTSLRKSVLTWPVVWRTDAFTWGYFIYLCLLEDRWTAKQWQQDRADIKSKNEDSALFSAKAALMETYSKWMPRLSFKLEAWPMSVTGFQWQPSPDETILVIMALDRLQPYRTPCPIAKYSHLQDEKCLASPGSGASRMERPLIAPLNRLQTPSGLAIESADIIGNTNQNEVQLVHEWVKSSTNENTVKSRRSAVEKLLNWAYFKKGKPLVSLTQDDFAEFSTFISNPQPAVWWVALKSNDRSSFDWAPFKGHLSQNARRLIMSHVSALAKWLTRQGYANISCQFRRSALDAGFANIGLEAKSQPRATIANCLTEAEWRWVMHLLVPSFNLNLETKLIIQLLYFGELKINEILRIAYCNISFPNSKRENCHIKIVDKERCPYIGVITPPPLTQSIKNWFEQSFVVEKEANDREGMGDRLCFDLKPAVVHSRLKWVFHQAALLAAKAGDTKSADLLKTRTAMSLRRAFSLHLRGADPMGFDYLAVDEWIYKEMSLEGSFRRWMAPDAERLWLPHLDESDGTGSVSM